MNLRSGRSVPCVMFSRMRKASASTVALVSIVVARSREDVCSSRGRVGH